MENLQNQPGILSDFVVFVLSHGNPYNVCTVKSLQKYGYTGRWYIVLDDEDTSYDEYANVFGKEKLLLFNKAEVAKTFDGMDLSTDYRTVVYARNACFQLARELGITYFMELDDDYYEFQFRYDDGEGHLRCLFPTSLDCVFEEMLSYFISIPTMKSLCMAQNGDFMGGTDGSHFKKRWMRKAMNTFICSTERPFTFIGRVNEDVNTYSLYGSRGELFCTIMDVSINQTDTQQKSKDDGMTSVYAGDGTYAKSFYTVMCCPSFVKIGILGNNHARIHHNVDWEHGVPKIISDRFRKE